MSIRPESSTWSSLSHCPCEKTGSTPRSPASRAISSTSKPVTPRGASGRDRRRGRPLPCRCRRAAGPCGGHAPGRRPSARRNPACGQAPGSRSRDGREGDEDPRRRPTGRSGQGPESSEDCIGASAGRSPVPDRFEPGKARETGWIISIGFRCVGLFFHQTTPFRLGALVPLPLLSRRPGSSRPLLARRSPAAAAGRRPFMISIHSSTIRHNSA